MLFGRIAGKVSLAVAFTLSFGLALACSESTDPGSAADARSALDTGETLPVDAPAARTSPSPSPSADAATGAATELAGEAAEDPSVGSCLDLVRAGKFAEAISPCTAAARSAPGNTEVTAALEQAKSEAMNAGAAGDAAAGAASDAAAGAVGGLGDRMP